VVGVCFAGLGYYVGTKDKASEQNVVLPKEKAMPWEGENGDTGDLFKYKVFRRSISRRDVNWPVSSKRKSKESTQAGTSLPFFF